MDWSVYLLECGDGSVYTGITNNLEKRMQSHESGKGAKYTRGRGPFSLRFSVGGLSRSDAARLEYAIKTLSAREKIKLTESGDLSIVGFASLLSNKK